jgi:hypothetical protein
MSAHITLAKSDNLCQPPDAVGTLSTVSVIADVTVDQIPLFRGRRRAQINAYGGRRGSRLVVSSNWRLHYDRRLDLIRQP